MGKKLQFLGLLVLSLCLLGASPAEADAGYAADGNFEDWKGTAAITDSLKDADDSYDLQALKWGTNSTENRLYVNILRRKLGKQAFYGLLYIDTNDDGDFTSDVDRKVQIEYYPTSGAVNCYVITPKGRSVRSYYGKWGERFFDGGQQLEFCLDFNDLGILPGQALRMYSVSGASGSFDEVDQLPDTGVIQFAPFPTLQWWQQGLLVGLAGVLIWRQSKGRGRQDYLKAR